MTGVLEPRDQHEVQRIVAWALAEDKQLAIEGRGSKRNLEPPRRNAEPVSLRRLSGVIDYQPEELVITAHAGTRLADIEELLAQRSQMLAFEPPDVGAVLGGPPADGSIGGALACNLAGPRRISAGSARDHFLGFNAVNGRGEIFKSGGKVMKNVTGYDLSKLMAGSRGTLAVLDEVTVKVVPAPECTATLLVPGHDEPSAVDMMCRAMGSAHDVSAAAHLPAKLAQRSAIDAVRQLARPVTALRLEGVTPSVRARFDALAAELADRRRCESLDTLESLLFWRDVRDVRPLWPAADPTTVQRRELWRISLPPASGATAAREIVEALPGTEVQYDWSGGLLWLSIPAGSSNGPSIRRAIAATGGHAMAVCAAPAAREHIGLETPALAALSQRIRDSFDPKRIFA